MAKLSAAASGNSDLCCVSAESDSEAEAWWQNGHPSGCAEFVAGQSILSAALLLYDMAAYRKQPVKDCAVLLYM